MAQSPSKPKAGTNPGASGESRLSRSTRVKAFADVQYTPGAKKRSVSTPVSLAD